MRLRLGPVLPILAVLLCLAPSVGLASQGLESSSVPMGPILSTVTYVSNDSIRVGDTIWLAVRLNIEPGWHVNSAHPLADYLIPTRLDLSLSEGFMRAGDLVYPDGKLALLIGDTMSVYESGTVLFAPVLIGQSASGLSTLSGTLRYQGCDNNSCVAPDQAALTWKFNVGSARSVVRNPDVFAPVISTTASMEATGTTAGELTQVQQDSDLQRLVRRYGFWGYILALGLAFVTGLLLSFSPCTYPMIPITVSIFAGQARGPGRGFFLSMIYVLTMAVIYGIMGVVVATVGGVFGAWLAHPVVVAVIAAIFVTFSLSMFGLYELQVPEGLRNRMAGKGGGGGIGGVIVLGAVAALVVSPCVGPFVAGIMVYIATTGSALMGFAVLFTFALGLGTLFVLIGTFSSAIQSLPRAGMWMESVKKFFGFILLLMALYFLRTLVAAPLLALLTGLLLLAAGVFAGGLDRLTGESTFFPRLKKAFGVLSLLIATYLLVGYLISTGLIWPPVNLSGSLSGTGSAHAEKIPWRVDLSGALSSAQAEKKPVVIDTWATWCANCKRLDRDTWSDDAVAAEAARFTPIKLQLETNDSPQTREFLQKFALKQYSLPTIILLDSSGRVHDVIFGFVHPDEMLARLRAVS